MVLLGTKLLLVLFEPMQPANWTSELPSFTIFLAPRKRFPISTQCSCILYRGFISNERIDDQFESIYLYILLFMYASVREYLVFNFAWQNQQLKIHCIKITFSLVFFFSFILLTFVEINLFMLA